MKVITVPWAPSSPEPSNVPLLRPRPPVHTWVYSESGSMTLETSSVPPAGPILRTFKCHCLVTLSPFHRWGN